MRGCTARRRGPVSSHYCLVLPENGALLDMASAETARPNARRFRSMLFAPGNNAKFIPKVFDSGADAVILVRCQPCLTYGRASVASPRSRLW